VKRIGVVLLLAAGCVTPQQREENQRAAEVHYDLGVTYMDEGKAQDALAEFMKAVELDDTLSDAWNALGLLYHLSLREPEKAEAAFKRAVELRPDFSEAWNNLGFTELDRKRPAESVTLFRKALENPLYRERYVAQGNLGWALYQLGQKDAGLSEIKSALVLNPKYCLGYRQLGTIYKEAEQHEQALAEFEKYVKHCGKEPDAHHKLGLAQAKLGKVAEARASFTTCVQLAGEKPIAEDCGEALKLLEGGGN
jgi:type IV pilus biogenesis/stability protein PilW